MARGGVPGSVADIKKPAAPEGVTGLIEGDVYNVSG